MTGINSDNNELFYSILTGSFCRFNPKGNCLFGCGRKRFSTGTDRQCNLPSFPAAMPSPFSLTGSNDRIWHNGQLSLKQRWKKSFLRSVFLPNPFLPCFLSLPHFLPLSTLNENYCHKVKACNVEIRLHTIIGTFALFLTISLLIWLQVFLLQVKKKKKPHWIKCEISMSCMIFNKCCHNLQALNLKCSDITTPEWP